MIAIEKSDQILVDGMPLFEADWQETSPFVSDFNLDVVAYKRLEEQGRLLIITDREDGVLRGYIAFIMAKSLQNQAITAQCAGLYVAEKYRGAGLARGLIEASAKACAIAGVDKIKISTSPKNDIGPLLESYGLVKEETVYSIKLSK
jgi:GNAT superfamily N-acetyltransferase